MKHIRIFSAALLILSLTAQSLSGQSFNADTLARRWNVFAGWCSPEKLYLHLDRTYFATGETVWFKGYLENASSGALQKESNYIYVELLDQDGEIVTRVKIRRKGNGFPGSMLLSQNLKGGDYTLRAYTLWQMNGSADYMFHQKIRILASNTEKKKMIRPSTSIADITFYPESGRYFFGYKSVVAFKAMDAEGRSLEIEGWIVDEVKNPVVPVKTKHDGMGLFEFIPVPGKTYSLLADGKTYPLPSYSEEGGMVNLRWLGESLVAVVRAFGEGESHLLVRDCDNIAEIAAVPSDGRSHSYKMPSDLFRPGINHLLLVNSANAIIAERMFFIYDSPAKTPVCSFTSANMRPSARALINGKLSLKNPDGTPLDAECSVSVVRGSLKSHHQDDGLLSYMRLSGELKGCINDPCHYFDPSIPLKERAADMDLLMMVQGWRYYDIEKILDPSKGDFQIKHLKEFYQSVRGWIDRTVGGKVPKKFILSIIIPKLKITRFVDVEQGSNFLIDSLDFKEGTEFLINVNRRGLGFDYIPKWSGDVFAPSYKYFPAPGIASFVPEEEKIPLQIEGEIVDTLSAAVVSASANDTFDGLTFGMSAGIEDLKMYRNYTLIQYLKSRTPAFEYNGDGMYNLRVRRTSLYAEENDSGEDKENSSGANSFEEFDEEDGAVKLIVDESEQPWWGYDMVQISDIEAISISTMPDPVYGGSGGCVMIKMRSGANLERAGATRPSLLYFMPLGYQEPTKFYSPRYDKGGIAEGEFDHRNTIHWAPNVKIKAGLAVVPFCNTDQMDYPYCVRIEGRTSDGIPFSHYCTLDFKENW